MRHLDKLGKQKNLRKSKNKKMRRKERKKNLRKSFQGKARPQNLFHTLV